MLPRYRAVLAAHKSESAGGSRDVAELMAFGAAHSTVSFVRGSANIPRRKALPPRYISGDLPFRPLPPPSRTDKPPGNHPRPRLWRPHVCEGRCRFDLTHHPFSTRFSDGGVRITTRASDRSSVNCSNEFHLMFAAADYQALQSSLFRHMRRLPFSFTASRIVTPPNHGAKKSPAKRKLDVH